jgi:hypothetical protein
MIGVLGQTRGYCAPSAVRADSSLAKFFLKAIRAYGYCSASGVYITHSLEW